MMDTKKILICQLMITGAFFILNSGCKKEPMDYTGQKGTVTDIDGNVYQTIGIGKQIWMAENLKTTRYNDGSLIPLVTDSVVWAALSTPGYCWYNNDADTYKQTYGALYNWITVNTGKLAPTGWHIPTDAEWTTLTEYLGKDGVAAGGKMKSTGTIEAGTGLWYSPNTHATNESGFTAVPAGRRLGIGPFDGGGAFDGICYGGFWWSLSEGESGRAWTRNIACDFEIVFRDNIDKSNGCSVRCLRN
jgi:uncharacterized protein (TIGR02145 family)